MELYPAFIRDNPVMQGAFASFMSWAWRTEVIHAAFREDTGSPALAPTTSPLDQMIDQATGYEKEYATKFVHWVIDTQWGVEGRDDRDSDASLAENAAGG